MKTLPACSMRASAPWAGRVKRAWRTREFKTFERMADRVNVVEALRTDREFSVGDFEHAAWGAARPVALARYWSGADAPPERHAEARLVWTDEALYVRFDCRQAEPLVVNPAPRTDRKTLGLWDYDVCEIFVAPDTREPERYFEFEAAPTEEWLDLAIRWRPDGRETDWDFRSGMETAALVREGSLTIAMRIPWSGLGRAPRSGDRWRANLFRCIGSGETRGYLAWLPTRTEEPSFHVPQKFGWLEFC